MISAWWVRVGVELIAVGGLLCAWGWYRARERAGLALRRVGELEKERDRACALLEQANAAMVAQSWARWWLLNALESHPDTNTEREAQIRLALAAFCAAEPADLVGVLRRVVASPATPRNDRAAAQLVVAEWDAAERSGEAPWVTWQRATGKGWADMGRLREVFGACLSGWRAVLGPKQFALACESPREWSQDPQ